MDNVNLIDSIKNTNKQSTRQTYSLDEILFIMKLLSDQVSLDEVSKITGRSKNTLRYKFLEGEVVINGKTVVRSVKKYNSMQQLFEDHNTPYLGDDDVKARIEQYRTKLNTTQQAV